MRLKMAMALLGAGLMLNLTACQSAGSSTKLIAGAFNASTEIQKKLIDQHAPQGVRVQADIQYMQNPDLHIDLYQPADIAVY